jgi:hypothetical protein
MLFEYLKCHGRQTGECAISATFQNVPLCASAALAADGPIRRLAVRPYMSVQVSTVRTPLRTPLQLLAQ